MGAAERRNLRTPVRWEAFAVQSAFGDGAASPIADSVGVVLLQSAIRNPRSAIADGARGPAGGAPAA